MKYRVCLLGCGDLGTKHAEAWEQREDAEIVAIYNRSEGRRLAAAERFGAVPYDDWREAVSREDINVVSICLPNSLHGETACFAAEHGRHILCEKPIALTLDEADRMIEAARANDVALAIAFQRRGAAHYLKIREMFAAGEFGGPLFFRINDVREVRGKLAMHQPDVNGGPVIDMGCHLFDIVRFVTGKEALNVHARGHVFGRGKERLKSLGGNLAIDAASIEVEYEEGNVLSLFLCWGMPEGYPETPEELIVGPALSARFIEEELRYELQYGDHIEHWIDTPKDHSVGVNALCEAIEGGLSPRLATGEDGRAALHIALAALESIQTGQVVSLK